MLHCVLCCQLLYLMHNDLSIMSIEYCTVFKALGECVSSLLWGWSSLQCGVTHCVHVAFTAICHGTPQKAFDLPQLRRPLSCQQSGGHESDRSMNGWPVRRRRSGHWWRRGRDERRSRGRKRRLPGCGKNRWAPNILFGKSSMKCTTTPIVVACYVFSTVKSDSGLILSDHSSVDQ